MRSVNGAVLAVLVGLAVSGAYRPAQAKDVVRVGVQAPLFTLPIIHGSKKDLAKRRLSLRDHVGPQSQRDTVLLNFAASYCSPCMSELSEMKARASAFKRAGVTVVIVVIDVEPNGQETMRRFIADKLALPFVTVADRFGVLARRYQASELPRSVLISGDGTVRAVQTGYTKDSLDGLLAAANHLGAARLQGAAGP